MGTKMTADELMIRPFRESDLTALMQIWLDSNLQVHDFIQAGYWTEHYAAVQALLPQAELYVYEDDGSGQIGGFIGLTGNYIAGLFVKKSLRSKGIGKGLLEYVKALKTELSLNVYRKNIRAIAFYRREHFVVQSESIDEATGEEEFFMIWRDNL